MTKRNIINSSIVYIIFGIALISLWVLLRDQHQIGRIYDAKMKCLTVSDDYKLTRTRSKLECDNLEAQFGVETDGTLSTIIFNAPNGPLCLENKDDVSVQLAKCSGNGRQLWVFAEGRFISNFDTKALCLTTQSDIFNSASTLVLKVCSNNKRTSQSWIFEIDQSVFWF